MSIDSIEEGRTEPAYTELQRALLEASSAGDISAFLEDLMTGQELSEMRNRWLAAQMLYRGVRYSEIEAATGLSSTTVARVSKWLKQGKGGYLRLLRQLDSGTGQFDQNKAGKK